jgi:hypothetical protein
LRAPPYHRTEPSGIITGRGATSHILSNVDCAIGGYPIKAGTTIYISPWAMPAQAVTMPGRGPIRIAYVRPEDKAHEPIYRTLRDRRVLERIRDRLSDWRLPRRLTIRAEGCRGEIQGCGTCRLSANRSGAPSGHSRAMASIRRTDF